MPRKSSNSLSSTDPTDGLSIRFISGPGISATSNSNHHHPPNHHPASTTNSASSSSDSSNHQNKLNLIHRDNQISNLPEPDGGYIKDSNGSWIPIQSNHQNYNTPNSKLFHPNRSIISNFTPSSPRSLDHSRGISKIPISAVTLGRVLAGDTSAHSDLSNQILPSKNSSHLHHSINHSHPSSQNIIKTDLENTSAESSNHSNFSSPSLDHQPNSSISEPNHTLIPSISRPSRSNPFFNSSSGRDRGAMIHQNINSDKSNSNGNNTTRVITTLQSDLLYARTSLDQSKSQLRLSQRAVESLSRQNDDLKESMARLRLENEGLSKMLNRKERTVGELMERVKRSESELTHLKHEKKELDNNFKKISKETDEIVKDALRKKDRAESQYDAIRSGVKSLGDGWKRDVNELRDELKRLEEKHRKEMDDNRMKYNTLAKLHASRSGSLSTLESNILSLQTSKENFITNYKQELKALKDHLEIDSKSSTDGLKLAKEVSDECARFKRILRNHS